MKKHFIFPALCALMLSACGGNSNNTQQPASDKPAEVAVPENKPADKAPEPVKVVDVAQNVLKLLDKKLVQFGGEFGITDAEFSEAVNRKREFDEYITPLKIVVTHQSDCYSSVSVMCFEMTSSTYFALVVADEGCDAGASRYAKCFVYNQESNTLAETENPIKVPSFDEYVSKGTVVEGELKDVKVSYHPTADLGGLDIRSNEGDEIEIRPAGSYSNETWDEIVPVIYDFDGKTLVKK